MSLAERVEARVDALVHRLVLPPRSPRLLMALAAIDLDPEVSAERTRADEQGRKGVISWRALLGELAADGATEEEADELVGALSGWGLLHVVGHAPSDPLVPGTAALRLTHAGRAALGLAPGASPAPRRAGEEPRGWEVWHGASREGLLWEASRLLGAEAPRALRVVDFHLNPAVVAGRVALCLLQDGFVILDVCGQTHPDLSHLLEDLLLRTRLARGRRLLLAKGPAVARVAALGSGATLRWVELPIHGSQHVGFYDERVTERLLREHAAESALQADVCGMPESDRAYPRRCSIHWDDLLFAPSVRLQLDQALANARYRTEILPKQAGFPGSGAGYRLLLSGLPGTGKSMASEALASALGRPLLVLDLSAVLSKWLGETEKFLSQVFEMSELGGCLLLLDEAEALFRQRSGDEGSGGGGASAIQTIVAFLLTRLERYSGVLVATTNRVKDLDEAFFRRFDDFIVVPLPDPDTRLRMWRRMLGLERAPAPGVDLDLLARRFAISGGLIRGAALRAAAWASFNGQPLSTPLVLAALGRELEKNDRSPSEIFVEPYRAEVQALLKGPDASEWD